MVRDLVQSIGQFRNDAERKAAISPILDKLFEAQNNALEMQGEYSKLVNEKVELEKKLAEIDNWQEEQERYELTEIASDVFVYKLKNPDEGQEPQHYFCVNCYGGRKKSILQRRTQNLDGIYYKCGLCDFEIIDHSKLYVYSD